MALTQAVIADVVSPRERGRYQFYISAVWATSSLCGPLVGGFVAQNLSWRWIFWINLPIGGVALWVCHDALGRLSSPERAGRVHLDVIGMLLLAGSIVIVPDLRAEAALKIRVRSSMAVMQFLGPGSFRDGLPVAG